MPAALTAFFLMGGYAFYVWLAVAMTVLPLALLMAHTFYARRALRRDIARREARERRRQQAQAQADAETPL
ncbi:heme exporter protein CcmD [Cronobacter dublinensis]|uniref:heme exporter protein CcmD n=1 Tax=Cronobacter dublinensis TaxID=413497 RepID=UPI000CFCC7CD|nr:heme exporter protein CcmD [Cronobacter dublinensis]EGT4377996.1 heme exporter protein CcmD [Cronobacter dublinensis]EKM6459190.1 heme exporter protein CcmD [Cronobacter dublinensis]EKP4477191.1 heme exporter protein CcmD [Cronobacter dublinensis]EKY3202491.1 heme exporter protein CcmD [Cronobacter dublinensis]ELQ6156537.1 heme exporter protein CcmD [Cronobacter dublinensis]